MSNDRKRPRIDPLVRMEYEYEALQSRHNQLQAEHVRLQEDYSRCHDCQERDAVHQAELIAIRHAMTLFLLQYMIINRRLQVQLRPGWWDEV